MELKRPISVVSVLLVLAAVLTAASTGTGPLAQRQLASFPGYAYSLGGGGARLGWIDTAFMLRLRTLSSSQVSSIRYTKVSKEAPNFPSWRRRLVVNGSGELWWSTTHVPEPFDNLDRVLFAAKGASKATTLLKILSNPGGTDVAGIAGDATGFAYGKATVEPTTPDQTAYHVTGGGVYSVDTHGKQTAVPGVPPAWVYARAGGRVVDEPVATDDSRSAALRRSNIIELRTIADGTIVRTWSIAGVRAAALNKTTVALLVGRTLRRYGLSNASPGGSTALPSSVTADLETDGTVVVGRSSHSILVVNLATGKLRTIPVPMPWHPTGVAVVSGSVVWSESKGHTNSDPSTKTFDTRILCVKLASL